MSGAPGISAKLSVSKPSNGSFFVAGEQPSIKLQISETCNSRPVAVTELGTANLYLHGPRRGALTKSANKLLNCVTDRQAKDRQHHFINLIAPQYGKPAATTLSADKDQQLTYQLAAISDEAPGTYTAALWIKSKDEKDQLFVLADLQIGTATREEYASGPATSSSCDDCHRGTASGKSYMAHIAPGFSPLGNYALDSAPIGTCKACHNLDGYSQNPIVRKVHGAHRGEHMLAPGVAHPEYGLGADTTLAAFTNVGFPSMPDAEKDCAKCHRDDRWKTAPSRLACGTCHDNIYFDKGALDPPRALGKPAGGSCRTDDDCASFGQLAGCDADAGLCVRKLHPRQADDSQCATCHTADDASLSPIPARHEVLSRTRVRGLKLLDLSLSGGTGPGGVLKAGDTPTLQFRLVDKAGAPVADLKTNTALAGTVIVGGPTDDRQRIAGPLTIRSAGTLSYEPATSTYSYVFPAPLPAGAIAPLNTTAAFQRPNQPGTYTLWLYVTEALTYRGQSYRDVASSLFDFRFGDDQVALRPRQVITQAACDSCHVQVQAHGGSRRSAEGCSLCHSRGANDRIAGAKGAACSADADCRGAPGGWESCQDTNSDSRPDTCVITVDPTPGQLIEFPWMIHSIHFARLREGYRERNYSVGPGALTIIGFQNTPADLSEILLPQDVRNCTKCHADTSATCSAAIPCGVGQACSGGRCVNRSFTNPSTMACLGCHDMAGATGHAALMTWKDDQGTPVETCGVCHGPDADFAVEKVHNITAPYKPPYSREKE